MRLNKCRIEGRKGQNRNSEVARRHQLAEPWVIRTRSSEVEPCSVGTQIFEGEAQLAADGTSGGCHRGIVELRPRLPQGMVCC